MKKTLSWSKKGLSFLAMLGMVATLSMPFVLYPATATAAGTVVIDTINGEMPPWHCIAGDLIIIGHGTRDTNGGPWSLDINWGDGVTDTIDIGSNTNNHGVLDTTFTFSASHTPQAASNGIILTIYHGTDAGNDGFTPPMTNQCIAAPTQGVLTVAKHVVNNSGGQATAPNFILKVANEGVDVTNSPFPGLEAGTDFQLDPGTYTVSELPFAGYTQTGITGSCAANGTVTIVAGENYMCTITNDDLVPVPPTLTINKIIVPSTDSGLFNLRLDGTTVGTGANVGNGGTTGQVTTTAGLHTISETAGTATSLAGYTAAMSGDCAADGSITLANGNNKVCTITNTKLPTLTLIKNVNNNFGGTKQVSDFILNIDGSPVLSGATTIVSVGAHTATEINLAGYTGSSWGQDCAADGTITLAAGENKTCTITNNDIQATLNVTKHMVNDNGGTNVASDFTMHVAGPTPLSFAGAENPGVTNSVSAGDYTVTETGPAGYALSYLGNCNSSGNLSLAVGENKSCILTNDDQSPHVIVKVHVINDNGGALVAPSTTVNVTGTNVLPASTFAGDENGYTVSLNANSAYGMDAASVTGYTKTLSSECSSTTSSELNLNETRTCTITLNDAQAKLTVTKVVVNDNGGTKQIADFPLLVDETSVTSGVQQAFNAGTYTISEVNQAGYTGVITGDCNADGMVTLAIGDEKTCTITNNDQPGHLIVHKVTDPSSDTTTEFSITVSGGTVMSPAATQTITGGASVDYTVHAGTYSVSEANLEDWSVLSNTCSEVTVANGQTVNCTITNTKSGVLIIRKVVVNDDNGTKVASDFSFKINDGDAIAFEADGMNNIAKPAGTYTITEVPVSGYTATYGSCSEITLSAGEEKVCIITNNDNAPTPSGGGGGGGGAIYYSITTSAGPHGSISPLGGLLFAQGSNPTFTMTPESGYQVSSVSVDNILIGNPGTVSFANLSSSHTLSALFALTNTGGGGGETITPPITPGPTGDFNGDKKVDYIDFSIMMANWEKTGSNICDLNNNQIVNEFDLALLLINWNE